MAVVLAGGPYSGSTSLSNPIVTRIIAFSGQMVGQTLLSDTAIHTGSGTTSGSTTLSSPVPNRIRIATPEVMHGYSDLQHFYAPPLRGVTTLAGLSVLWRLEPDIDALRSFAWGHRFQRGDLNLFLSKGAGGFSPYEVTYSLYRALPGDIFVLVGTPNRKPVVGAVGEYFVVGTAGEQGQPGVWEIRWSYRQSFRSPQETQTMRFRIDASTSTLQYCSCGCR